MLVVLEGLDGAGKSTQVKKLRTYLEGLFGSLEYIHFPRYDAPVYGDLISRFLRGDFGDNETVHPQLVALLFAEDRHGAGPQMKQTLRNGGHLAAICAAPLVLGRRGLLKGKRATCYPGFENELIGAIATGESVVTDGNITTAKGMGVALEFSKELITLLVGKEKAEDLSSAIMEK